MTDDQDGFKASLKDSEGVNAALHLCIADRDEVIAALRARVAKLEAALLDCKRYAEDHDDEWVPFRVDDALEDAPQ